MSHTHSGPSPRWHGNPRQYQLEAQAAFAIYYDRQILPWSWVITDCNVAQCLDPECMTLHTPRRIAYPEGVCCYCGDSGGSKDHLLPKPVTGEALRHLIAVVPSCRDCNTRINDEPSPSVAVRRRRAQVSMERNNSALLLRPTKGPEELAEIGPHLRSVAIKNNEKARRLKLRLSWPEDPYYDIRAFQKSGIEDPVALGLCDPQATPLRPEYVA